MRTLAILALLLSGCVTANPVYRDCSGISHDRYTGTTHPDMRY